ncbi:MAG: hypothetical protein IH899_16950 [Planctomycetes bacterium]|nr:hypothetical protein [Planctomycetota bacterium]
MKLLVLLSALLLAGCSVEVAHETEYKAQTESLSTFDKSKTAVSLGILKVPEIPPKSEHTASQESSISSSEQSQTTVKVIVAESSPKVITTPTPPVPRRPDRLIQVTGSGNAVVFGDVHIHHHEHLHFHQAPKPHPVRVDVRVELGDRFSEREKRTRMVERRIAKFFPHYGN